MSRLVRGLHPAGSRIHEGQLAAELGVSRTPVREALMHLQQQGVLEVRPNSGFYVVPITATDIEEVYPIIGALESLAVRLTALEEFDGILAELGRLASEMETTTDQPRREQELDNAWHALLVSRCGNTRLISTIQELKVVVSRYESGFMTDPESVRTSAEQHRIVVEALVAGDRSKAEDLVVDNWESGMRRLLAWHDQAQQGNRRD
jgi:DNA-binding GntR family transcriptional regulator